MASPELDKIITQLSSRSKTAITSRRQQSRLVDTDQVFLQRPRSQVEVERSPERDDGTGDERPAQSFRTCIMLGGLGGDRRGIDPGPPVEIAEQADGGGTECEADDGYCGQVDRGGSGAHPDRNQALHGSEAVREEERCRHAWNGEESNGERRRVDQIEPESEG